MKAKILFGFKSGARQYQPGEVIETNKRAAGFLFSVKYAEPVDDEARQFCQERGYVQSPPPASAGT